MNSRPFDPQSNALTRLRYIPTKPLLPATYQYSIFCEKVKTYYRFSPETGLFLSFFDGSGQKTDKKAVSLRTARCPEYAEGMPTKPEIYLLLVRTVRSSLDSGEKHR